VAQIDVACDPGGFPPSSARLRARDRINRFAVSTEAISGRGRHQKMAAEKAFGDSGPGIPDDVASRLFQPFVTTKRQNMGMGLSICRRLSWRMAGNSGTSHAQAVERSSGSQCRRLLEMTLTSERIVHIVDDDTDFRQ
jgi:K+-sensing histidine kinase KdpD